MIIQIFNLSSSVTTVLHSCSLLLQTVLTVPCIISQLSSFIIHVLPRMEMIVSFCDTISCVPHNPSATCNIPSYSLIHVLMVGKEEYVLQQPMPSSHRCLECEHRQTMNEAAERLNTTSSDRHSCSGSTPQGFCAPQISLKRLARRTQTCHQL